jgi:dTDP-4-dehydrorhamnose 3,5-epimerase
MYVPEGFAHGYITLSADAEIFDLVSRAYAPGYERGVRYDDPRFNIRWPASPQIVSDKDRTWPDFSAEHAP